MFNKIYEEYYDKYFLSYYKENEVKCDNVEQSHSYSIPLEKREKLYHLDVYTIDPEGCSDADDAFSIAPDIVSGKLFLYIHIADPTEYICLSSSLWQQICLGRHDDRPHQCRLQVRHRWHSQFIPTKSSDRICPTPCKHPAIR